MVNARCLSCDHTWSTRKPPDEIDRPRCAECGADRDEIQFGEDDPPESHEVSIINEVERETQRDRLIKRVKESIERIENAAPPGKDSPDRLTPTYRRLTGVLDHLVADEDENEGLTLTDLEKLREYVQRHESELEDIPELNEIEDLQSRVKELRGIRDGLEVEIGELEAERDRLERDVRSLNNLFTTAESNEKLYARGFIEGVEAVHENPTEEPLKLIEQRQLPDPA